MNALDQVLVKSQNDTWLAIGVLQSNTDRYILSICEVEETDLIKDVKIPLSYSQLVSIKLLLDKAII